MKSNIDFTDNILPSPKQKLNHNNKLKVAAEYISDSEINIKAVIPFQGKLNISNSNKKNSLKLISVRVQQGFFMSTIPITMHFDIDELHCTLSSSNKTQRIVIGLLKTELLVKNF